MLKARRPERSIAACLCTTLSRLVSGPSRFLQQARGEAATESKRTKHHHRPSGGFPGHTATVVFGPIQGQIVDFERRRGRLEELTPENDMKLTYRVPIGGLFTIGKVDRPHIELTFLCINSPKQSVYDSNLLKQKRLRGLPSSGHHDRDHQRSNQFLSRVEWFGVKTLVCFKAKF